MKTVHTLALAVAMALSPVLVAQAADPAQALTLGAEHRGEITSRSALNHQDGSRSALFSVSLREGQVARFELEGALKGRLTAFLDGELLASSPEGRDHPAMAVRARRAGTYTIAVSGIDASSYGPFTLISSELEAYAGGPLHAGAAISDWTDAPRTLPLEITESALYVIDLESDDFDPTLRLEGQGVSLRDDDGGEGLNSRITARLAPGTYTLTAQGYGDSINGLYQLRVAERALPDNLRDGGEIAVGSTITGLYEGTAQTFSFNLAERSLVRVDMMSDELDSKLTLSGADVSKSDDDGGEGLNSRISMLLDAGAYTLSADTYSAGSSGLYTLSVAASEAPEGAGGGELALGRDATATLLPGLTDRWSFDIRSAGDYVLTMDSTDLDSRLSLQRDGEEVASDDDGGDDMNARIEQHLDPGHYVLEASAYGGQSGGSYRIGVTRR